MTPPTLTQLRTMRCCSLQVSKPLLQKLVYSIRRQCEDNVKIIESGDWLTDHIIGAAHYILQHLFITLIMRSENKIPQSNTP